MGNKAWIGTRADGIECVVVARSPIEAARLARVDADDFPHRFDLDRSADPLLDRVRGVYVRDDNGQFTVKLRAQADVARALGLSRQAFNSRVDTWRGRGLSETDAIKKAIEAAKTGPVMPPGRPRKEAA